LAIMIETPNPGAEGVEKAVESYCRVYPEYNGALRMYGSVMKEQQKTLERIEEPSTPEKSAIEESLKSGVPILASDRVRVDPTLYRELLQRICDVAAGAPEGFRRCGELASWEGLSEENLPDTLERIASGELAAPGAGWDEGDRKLATGVLWEAIVPFYRKYGSICEPILDNSYWQRGFCPVCGGAPLIGMFRPGDGLWILECSLCHTHWNVLRARCPFCGHGPEGKLEYMYVDEDDTKRVQYCSNCMRYVKTVDERESEWRGSLPLDDIVTVRLDLAAEQEGLMPAEGYSGGGGPRVPPGG
jgi:formate dehydrogenase accessory protein FdhE